MRNLLYSGLLGFAAVLALSVSAQAGTFGLFIHHKCCKCCDGCSVCIRPYNAFTPVVSGTLIADGCFPFSSGFNNFGCGGAGCNGLCAIGETCASAPIESNDMAALQYQYMMYQQQMAAQYMMYQQPVAQPAMPYGSAVQPTGYIPAYNQLGR
jgi:hypothetical protein